MVRSRIQDAGVLVYPKHRLQPADLLVFSELTGFVNDWEEMGLDVEFDLLALQVRIMAAPKQGKVIEGTGGLRKMDFAPPNGFSGKKKGKRKSCRVCYVFFEEFHTVLLVVAYPKNKKGDLTHDEKIACKKAIERAHKSLSQRHYT